MGTLELELDSQALDSGTDLATTMGGGPLKGVSTEGWALPALPAAGGTSPSLKEIGWPITVPTVPRGEATVSLMLPAGTRWCPSLSQAPARLRCRDVVSVLLALRPA